jgi:hypothetical protein
VQRHEDKHARQRCQYLDEVNKMDGFGQAGLDITAILFLFKQEVEKQALFMELQKRGIILLRFIPFQL